MEKIYKTAIYLRLSRDDENYGESSSISNQRLLLKSFAENKKDIEIVSEYVDDGYTGYDFDRPGFQQMLKDIDDGKIDCIIVKDLSRLGRNFQKTEEYIQRIFPAKNVRFIAVSDCFDSAREISVTDRLAYPMKNLINEYHVMETSQKIRNVFEHCRQTGKMYTGMSVYGYHIVDKQFVIDEEAAEVVRMIFDLKISGMSNQGIANILNDKGIKSPLEHRIEKGYGLSGSHLKKDKKALWQFISVKRILENPVYIGALIQGKTTTASYKDKRRYKREPSDLIVFEHAHEAIVSETVFYIVQDLLSKDSYAKAATKKSYLFSGFAFCGNCGQVLYHENGQGKPFWVCRNKECDCKARLLEKNIVDGVFGALKVHVNAALAAGKPVSSADDVKISDNRDKLSELRQQLDQTLQARDKLAGHLKNEMISKTDYDELNAFYENKIGKLKNLIASVQQTKANFSSNFDDIRLMYQDIAEMKELTRGMIATFIDRIEIVNKKQIHIYFRFKDIFEESADGEKVKEE